LLPVAGLIVSTRGQHAPARPVGLEVPDAGMNYRRDPAAGDEKDTHERAAQEILIAREPRRLFLFFQQHLKDEVPGDNSIGDQ
jgi:hypothetical protein